MQAEELNKSVESTPMMMQYLEIKAAHKDCLLLFRMGDFYELFNDDAKVAAPILEIALTKRGKAGGEDIPMCGIPYHSADIYIQKLIKANHKVAICEQLESPEEAKKRGYKAIVKRDVVRIITPGTLTEDNLLDGKSSNYLAAIVVSKDQIAIAYTDISTTDFQVIGINFDKLASYLQSINPSEIIIADSLAINDQIKVILSDLKAKVVTFIDSFFDAKKTQNKLQENFNLHSTEGLISNLQPHHIAACGALLEYLSITQKQEKFLLKFPRLANANKSMVIDKITQSNLELFSSKGENNFSLLKNIDCTLTNSGGRLLREFLSFPSATLSIINQRLAHVEVFLNDINLLNDVRDHLKSTPDLERSIAKIAIKRGSPRDLYNVKDALEVARKISEILANSTHDSLQNIAKILAQNTSILRILDECLVDREIYLNQNDFIKRDYDLELAELYHFRDNSESLLEHLKNEYKQKTGVLNLKIEYNNVLGYYIEVTKSQASKVSSSEFVHRQTMINNVRFVTEKLKDIESKILGISRGIEVLENKLFQDISSKIVQAHISLIETAKAISYIDVISSFAKLAKDRKFCKPSMDDSNDLIIKGGRHPVVERSLEASSGENFIANDCCLNLEQKSWLITGPNMSGKSTFLRQNALIAILAHIGSFVPATSAKIGIIDRVFSRIGAGDDIAKGHSTFLVEMIETAIILNQATQNSLIILDEIGRGTSTYDGMAIAWSCLEYIHTKLKSRTLFSTHYHELTELSKGLANLKCYTVQVKEWKDKVIFMHTVIQGVADRSYGINVAAIAGVPKSVIDRSKEILKKLHDENNNSKNFIHGEQLELAECTATNVEIKEDRLRSKLAEINPDNMSPKEALDMLYELKKEI